MANVAQLGAEFDTAGLQAGVVRLRQVAAESAKAEVAVKKLERTQASASLAAARASHLEASAALKAAQAAKTYTASELASLKAARDSASVRLSAARAVDAGAAAAYSAAQATDAQAAAALRLAQAQDEAVTGQQRLNVAMNDNTATAGQMRANFTNMAAQFQDIGVTAAMGMNPMMIGLQQGAQMSGIFTSMVGTMGQKLALVGQGILAFLTPLSLLTIGLVAATAAAIQFVDWTALAKSALLGLAGVMDIVMPVAAGLALALALFYAPAIIAGIWSVATAIVTGLIPAIISATETMLIFMMVNPWGAFVIGVGVIVAALIIFRDFFSKLFGTDVVKLIKKSVDFIVATFMGMARTIVFLFSNIGNAISAAIYGAVNIVIRGVNWLSEKMNAVIGKDMFDQIDLYANKGADALSSNFMSAMDDIGGYYKIGISDMIIDGISDMADWAEKKLKGFANGFGKDDKKDKKDKSSKSTGKTDAEKFNDIINGANNTIATLKEEYKAIGLVGEAAKFAAAQSDLMNKVRSAGLKLSQAEIDLVNQKAAAIAHQQQLNESKKYYEDEKAAILESIDTLNAEIKTVGMSEQAASDYMYAQKLLNDERYRGIDLAPGELAGLQRINAEHSALTERLRANKEAYQIASDTGKEFFTSMISGLRNGEGVWKTFTNTVMNLLNKLIDKMIEMEWEKAFMGKGSGAGGVLKSIGNMFFNTAPSVGISTASTMSDLNAMSAANPMKFADGGAFTNGVVNKATNFSMGQMGEAGPEAIMPLQRGADGSLGVQMFGAANNNTPQPAVVQVVPSEYFNVVVDDRAGKVAAPMVVQGSIAATKVSEQGQQRQARRRIP